MSNSSNKTRAKYINLFAQQINELVKYDMEKSKNRFPIQNYVYFSEFVVLDAFLRQTTQTRGFTSCTVHIHITQGITQIAHSHSLGHIGKTGGFRAKLRECPREIT